MNKKHIFLTGFMGSGKSRIGKLLATGLNMDFVDTDDLIEKKCKKTIKQIFNEDGEVRFRELEFEVIKQLSKDKTPKMISLGGGALLNTKIQNIVNRTGKLIYIKAGLEEIWQRVKHRTKRPLLLKENKMLEKSEFMIHSMNLLDQRKSGYQKADIIIDRDGLEAEEVATLILEKIINSK